MVETTLILRWDLAPARVGDGFDPSTIVGSSLTHELKNRLPGAPSSTIVRRLRRGTSSGTTLASSFVAGELNHQKHSGPQRSGKPHSQSPRSIQQQAQHGGRVHGRAASSAYRAAIASTRER